MPGKVSDIVKAGKLIKAQCNSERENRVLPDITLRLRICVHSVPIKMHTRPFLPANPLFFLNLRFLHQGIGLKSAFLFHL